MSANVTPIRPPPMPEPGWVWNGQSWVWLGPHPDHPIWPPEPPRPPFCPPRPDCAPPSCFSKIAKAEACWDQSQELYEFLTKVISDIFANDPSIIPSPPPGSGSGPIIGVTDGSTAAPGEVGEVLILTTPGNFSVPVQGGAVFQTVVSGLTLSPGDWDVQAYCNISGVIMGGIMQLSPAPPEANGNNMFAFLVSYTQIAEGDVGAEQGLTLVSMVTPMSVAQPTLLPFSIIIVPGAVTPQTGTYTLTVVARRMR